MLRYLVFQRVQALDYTCPPRVWKKAGTELCTQSSEDVCRRQARQFIEAGHRARWAGGAAPLPGPVAARAAATPWCGRGGEALPCCTSESCEIARLSARAWLTCSSMSSSVLCPTQNDKSNGIGLHPRYHLPSTSSLVWTCLRSAETRL